MYRGIELCHQNLWLNFANNKIDQVKPPPPLFSLYISSDVIDESPALEAVIVLLGESTKDTHERLNKKFTTISNLAEEFFSSYHMMTKDGPIMIPIEVAVSNAQIELKNSTTDNNDPSQKDDVFEPI